MIMSTFAKIIAFAFYVIGFILILIPLFLIGIVLVIAYPFTVLYKDITYALKRN